MSLSLTRFSWWYWSNGKGKNPVPGSDSMKPASSKPKEARLSSNEKVKRKWKSREERKRVVMDKEYDVVLVPSDGVCLSASDDDSSYDSDWSVGWTEPHAPEFFNSDDDEDDVHTNADADNSFAVLVPCYRNDCKGINMEQQSADQLLNGFPAGGNKYMEQWLASLQNF